MNQYNIKSLNKLRTLFLIFTINCTLFYAQTTAFYPMDFVPHEETTTEISARETRLINHENNFFNTLNSAVAKGTLSTWIDNYLPKLNLSPTQVLVSNNDYVHALFILTKLSIDYNYPSLSLLLKPKLSESVFQTLQIYKSESQNDMSTGGTGLPYDLNTVQPANSMLSASICLKLLGAYTGAVKDSTEAFIERYVENKGDFDGFYQITGYNKGVFFMDIGSNVLALYPDEPTKYPVTKQTFESFWNGITKCSYDGDNSPHYDAGTGIWTALRMALTHNRLNDLKITDDFHRMLTRMAYTIMNSGETAKWGKSMGGTLNNNTQLTNDGNIEMSWTLKMGYKLFGDPFVLYVARKYEDLRLNGPVADWRTTITSTYPKDINFSNIKNVAPVVGIPTSLVTTRLTSKTAYNGLLLGRGDTNVKLVQDKLILSTGHHPRAPYFLMDLSYTQSKAAPDHRIGANNLMFDGTHLCTYLDRPGNGNQISRPYLCPDSYTYPLIPTKAGEVTPSSDYMSKVDFNPSIDYVLKTHSAKDIDTNVAYGVVEYSKFQYSGVSAKREVVLLHNGITIFLDRIKTDETYSGGHNAGVIYQVWPSIQAKDLNNRWVLQSNHIPTLVDKSANPNGFGTLYYFPQVGMATQAAIATDTARINDNINKTYSVSKSINKNDSVVVLSMVIPIRNTSLVQSLINSIRTSEKNGTYDIAIPKDATSFITVKFEPNKIPIVNTNATATGVLSSVANDQLELSHNIPNPFCRSTSINYSIKSSGMVVLKVYDVMGKEVATLVNTMQNSGKYTIDFNPITLPKGIYYYSLASGNFVSSKKMIYI